ncbi:MAG: L,D-transpeptidase family protein [Acidimicrobiales bacterium]
MNRSRTILLLAWGLLAVGALVQLVRPDNSTDQSEATASQDAEGDSADGAAGDEGTSLAYTDGDDANENARSVANSSGARSSGEAGSTDTASTEEPRPDPAGWREVKIELEPEAYVATVIDSTTPGHGVASLLEPAPGAVQHWFPSPTQFGGDRVFLVVDQTSSEEYVKVALPVMPNGQEGWVPRSQVEITKVQHRALVDLSAHMVTVWDADGVAVMTKAVTGADATPTPLGTFYVRDIVTQPEPEGSFGPYVLALSGFSEVLETFDGGLPALAIHGTDIPSQIGSGRSAGCIRIPNDLITILAESVPLGTPVTVVA